MQRQSQDPTHANYWIHKIEVATSTHHNLQQLKRSPDLLDASLLFLTGYTFFVFLLPNILSLLNNAEIHQLSETQTNLVTERKNLFESMKIAQEKIARLLNREFKLPLEEQWYDTKCASKTGYYWNNPVNPETPVLCHTERDDVSRWPDQCKQIYNTHCTQLHSLTDEESTISANINKLTQSIAQTNADRHTLIDDKNKTFVYSMASLAIIAIGIFMLINRYQANQKTQHNSLDQLLDPQDLANFKIFLSKKNIVIRNIEQTDYRAVINILKTNLPSNARQLYQVNIHNNGMTSPNNINDKHHITPKK